MRTPTAVAAVALLAAVTGCGGGEEPSKAPTPEQTTAAVEGATPGPQDPPATTYADTPAIVAAINKAIRCRQDGKPDVTLWTDRTVYCTYKAPDGAGLSAQASTYASQAQEDTAIDYFMGPDSPDPGTAVIAGDGWTVLIDKSVGKKVARATGGTYLPPVR